MSTKIIDGRKEAARIQAKVTCLVAKLVEVGIKPKLAILLIGEDDASRTYVEAKRKLGEAVGIIVLVEKQPITRTTEELIALVRTWGRDPRIHGILVQQPLPGHINLKEVLEAIPDEKDIEGLKSRSFGRLMRNRPEFIPCTPFGIRILLQRAKVSLKGRRVTIVNNTPVVGIPMSIMLINLGSTVAVCHEHTNDQDPQALDRHCRRADVIITATGVHGLIHDKNVRRGAVVIDAGISRGPEGIRGDASGIIKRAKLQTPVPGGVGPMTVVMVAFNLVVAARRQSRSLRH